MIAVECMKDAGIAPYLIQLIGKEVHKEIRPMASTKSASILGSQSKDDLISFTWTRLHEELTFSVQQPNLECPRMECVQRC